MTVYATLAELKSRMAGDNPVMSGANDRTIVDILAQVSDMLDEEVRNVRAQAPGWSFLASQAYGVQQVSVSAHATSGSFSLTFGSTTSVAIPVAASSTTVQSALDTILGSGNSVVTGAPGGPWTVTFAGTLSGPQPVLVPASSIVPTTTSAVVEELIVGSANSVTRRYTGPAGGSPLLLIDDCVSVSSVTILDRQGHVSQTLTAGTDYLPSPLNDLPITGLRLTRGVWPWYAGGVQVTLRPGFGFTIPRNVNKVVLQEAIRSLRGAQANEDDRLGVTPYGSVVVSKALLSSTLRICANYRFGAGFLRQAG